jgi:secondary thiamine-phosphate synthase enzyme
MKTLAIRSHAREEMIDITREVEACLAEVAQENHPVSRQNTSGSTPPRNMRGAGVCVLFVQHTSCGLTVNENADPDVQTDMLGFFQRLIPQHEPHFKHGEQNSDAHIKSSLVGSSVTVPFENGRLLLGRWQGIYLCEFDGPRERKIAVLMIGGDS